MKTFENPEITVVSFGAEDILSTSSSFTIPISTDPVDGSEAL